MNEVGWMVFAVALALGFVALAVDLIIAIVKFA
jgi:hypothetical protein